MRIKHWILALAVTLMLSSGSWAQAYASPRMDGAKVVNSRYRGDRYRAERREHRRHKRRHDRRHDRRHERRHDYRNHGR